MLDAFSTLQWAWAAGVVFGAYVVRGMSGFGAGLVATPLLAFLLPMTTVVPTTALIVFVLFIFLTLRDRHQVQWDEFKRLLPPTLIGVVGGLYLFTLLDNRLMLKLLGGFLLAYACYMLITQWVGMQQLKLSEKWAFPLGFLGAFIDSMFGGGGTPKDQARQQVTDARNALKKLDCAAGMKAGPARTSCKHASKKFGTKPKTRARSH